MNKKKSFFPTLILSLLLSLGFIAGCEEEGPAEEFGESVDEAAEDAQREIEDATD